MSNWLNSSSFSAINGEEGNVEIPYTELSEEALLGVMQEFVLREGTDYGTQEYSLEQKIEQVRAQLQSGKIRLTFDEESQTCNLERVD